MNILFTDALECALETAASFASALGDELTFVRDLRGKIRAILPSEPKNIANLQAFEHQLTSALGAYGFDAGRGIMFADKLGTNESLIQERRLIRNERGLNIYLLDRQIIGQDWMLNQLPRKTQNLRFTFYGIKGGVGRSTALVNWAWHLADQGKKVLIFDLDLESPGVSSSMLPISHLPDFGVVDWFVEDGVGQASLVENEMWAISPLAQATSGEIKIIPAYGKKTGEYLPKLSRCYTESGNPVISWAQRLQKLVEVQEEMHNPDVVIFDSRAGLHDIAAVLATRMDADTFLFGIDTPQTWAGYALLFEHWHNHPEVKKFRPRLQVIAGMVPELDRDDYLQGFKEHAWDLFRNNLYDEVNSVDVDSFTFDLEDESAPHAPVPIFWHRALQEFNPVVGGINTQTASESFKQFFEQADNLRASAIQVVDND